jgi:hypothetical protein
MGKTRKSIIYGEFATIRSPAGLNSIWEQLNKPDSNSVVFAGIRINAGLNIYKE